jgi:hypothetical protein
MLKYLHHTEMPTFRLLQTKARWTLLVLRIENFERKGRNL